MLIWCRLRGWAAHNVRYTDPGPGDDNGYACSVVEPEQSGLEPIDLSDTRLRALTINCNGIRSKRRRLALGHLSTPKRIGVCVVTESHLRRKDFRRLVIPGFVAVASLCRKADGKRIRGGAAILIDESMSAESKDDIEDDNETIGAFASRVFRLVARLLRCGSQGYVFPHPAHRGWICQI